MVTGDTNCSRRRIYVGNRSVEIYDIIWWNRDAMTRCFDVYWDELEDVEGYVFIFVGFRFDNPRTDYKCRSRCGLVTDDFSNRSNFQGHDRQMIKRLKKDYGSFLWRQVTKGLIVINKCSSKFWCWDISGEIIYVLPDLNYENVFNKRKCPKYHRNDRIFWQYVKTNTGSTYQPFTVTAFHSTKNTHLLNRTKVYNSGTRIKVEGAVELYNDTIYCELKNSTFVIPKNTTPTTDKNHTVIPHNPAVQPLSET